MPRSEPVERSVHRLTIEIPSDVHDALRAHAYLRNIAAAKLRLDILRGWLIAATDWNRPIFRDLTRQVAPIKAPYPGYIESLGFVGDGGSPDLTDLPIPPTPKHLDAAPETPEDLAFTQLSRIERL